MKEIRSQRASFIANGSGKEDGDAVTSRDKVYQRRAQKASRDRIDAGVAFVEDQHGRRCRTATAEALQALADAERKAVRRSITTTGRNGSGASVRAGISASGRW